MIKGEKEEKISKPIIICEGCGEEHPHRARGLCDNCYQRLWYREHPEKARAYNHKAQLESSLKYKYNITLADYDGMLENQGGVCAICGMTPEENGRRLSVDHNHKTDEIRGLLCRGCNTGIGLLRDDPRILARGIEYLLDSE